MVITNNRKIKIGNQAGHFTPSKQAISSHFHIKRHICISKSCTVQIQIRKCTQGVGGMGGEGHNKNSMTLNLKKRLLIIKHILPGDLSDYITFRHGLSKNYSSINSA